MTPFLLVTIVALVAGVCGLALGGAIGALFRTESNRTLSLLLSFAAGIMLALICFDLLAEAVESAHDLTGETGVLWVILVVGAGIVVVWGLDLIVERRAQRSSSEKDDAQNPQDRRSSLYAAGIIMACAIALHNVPEGMMLGVGFSEAGEQVITTSIILAILVALHNIPEGMAIALPLIGGGMSRARAVFVTALSGVPTILGGWLGYWVGDAWAFGFMVSLSFSSGALFYIVFAEIIPQAVTLNKSKAPAFFIMIGILLGLVLTHL